MQTVYVSCESGNDAWPGTLAQPNANGSNGPLRTLAAAQTAVRRIRRDMGEPETVAVVLGGGCYSLDRTWCFDAADSGFGVRGHFDGRTSPVIWRAADGAAVTVSGGRRVAGWQPAELNGRAVWRAEVPWMDGDERFFRQLWIDGERRPRARLPKTGTYRVNDNPEATLHWSDRQKGVQSFGFRPGDLSAVWSNSAAIEIQFRALWMSSRVRLREVDEAKSTVRVDRNTQLCLAYAPGDGVDYIVENVQEALTEPGEWRLDPTARCVWYVPRPGERPDSIEAIAGGIERLLDLRNTKFLRFENIVFAHAEWRPAATDAVTAQSSATVCGAIAVGSGCEGVTFEGCRITHVGGYGLECADGATEVLFRNGAIRDLGAGGVKIWHGCRRCVIEGSEICDGGHLWMSGAGVLIGKACGNTVTHCHIHDFYYTGISVGWTWGYAESGAYGNVIEWNHIHDLGKGLLSDMGGVYLLGNAPGTRVRHNRIHDIRSLRYGGWAMYPDEGSSDLLIENNLCYNTDLEVFHQHYGRNNMVRNNIFAYGGEAVLAYTHMEDHLGLIFEHNIIVGRGTPIVRQVDDVRWRSDRTRFDDNLYWCEDGEVRFEGGRPAVAAVALPAASLDFAAWQQHAGDSAGIIADPLFVDPARGDFRLQPDSPALQLGFTPFACPDSGCA